MCGCCCAMCVSAVAFWYKPDSSHKHLYPTKKDEEGNPQKVTINGEEQYAVCEYGIEIFNTREGPEGLPPLAPFATAVADSKKPRFDAEAARQNVTKSMDALNERFDESHRAQWMKFFDEYPHKVEDVPTDRLHSFAENSCRPCSLEIPSEYALSNHQAKYSESIRYTNPISGTQATSSQLNIACAGEADVPILQKGSVICILPPEDVLEDRSANIGERLPFWLAVVDEDEEAAIGVPPDMLACHRMFVDNLFYYKCCCDADTFGTRIHPPDPNDEFDIQRLSVFNTQGRVAGNVVGSWKPRCKRVDGRGRAHAWTKPVWFLIPAIVSHTSVFVKLLSSLSAIAVQKQDCTRPFQESCTNADHGFLHDKIKRESILLYNVQLTNTDRVNAESKSQICKAVEPHQAAASLMPTTWRSAPEQPRRRQVRRR
eukprot:6182559-Pleurochrysis_carterae.AAC.2